MTPTELLEKIKKFKGSYSDAKQISAEIDQILGFRYDEIERNLQGAVSQHQTWAHVGEQGFQTPYTELYEMVQNLPEHQGGTWCDLGAGYGRLGILLSWLSPNIKFKGYEVVANRVKEGQRIYHNLGITSAELICQDLADQKFELPQADVYFIYDFGHEVAVEAILEKLKLRARENKVCVIGRGRGIRNWISLRHPWLGSVIKPQHFETWTYYQSR